MEIFKTCSKCGEQLTLQCFSKQEKGKYGVTSICKECTNIRSRKWYTENKERKLKACKDYIESNKEMIAAKSKKYREANKEMLAESGRQRYIRSKEHKKAYAQNYYLENKSEYNLRNNKRRAAKQKAIPAWAKEEFEEFIIRELYDKASRLSDLTGNSYHVDHIAPLQSDTVCGLHCFSNLQIITAQENIKKANRYWPDMP